jgi:hypothetical protein
VFVNANVSIGLLLSCEIRNAHRSSAVLIYNDLNRHVRQPQSDGSKRKRTGSRRATPDKPER